MEQENLKRRIIDKRNKEKFQLDDAYLNGYARLCGVYATVVYNSLCRHSDRDQFSFPSIELMAEQHACSKPSIIKGIKALEEWGIILVHREKTEKGTQKNNGYTLIDKSDWKPKPSQPRLLGAESTTFTHPSKPHLLDRVNDVEHKDTHTKETHMKDIDTNVSIQAQPAKVTFGNEDVNWVLSEFLRIMGFASSGKKDRWCAAHLLREFTRRQIQALLTYSATDEFAPRIGSIEKLWYKRGDIIAGIKKFQQKKETKGLKIGSITTV